MSDKLRDSLKDVYTDLGKYEKPLQRELEDLMMGLWKSRSSNTLYQCLEVAGDKKLNLIKDGIAAYLSEDIPELGQEIAEEILHRIENGAVHKKSAGFSKENRPVEVRATMMNLNDFVVKHAVEQGETIGVTKAATPDDVFYDEPSSES